MCLCMYGRVLYECVYVYTYTYACMCTHLPMHVHLDCHVSLTQDAAPRLSPCTQILAEDWRKQRGRPAEVGFADVMQDPRRAAGIGSRGNNCMSNASSRPLTHTVVSHREIQVKPVGLFRFLPHRERQLKHKSLFSSRPRPLLVPVLPVH